MRHSLVIALSISLMTICSAAQADPRAQRSSQAGAPSIEVTFVLDTTGSMGGLIEGAKEKIWSIASKIASARPTPNLRVGLVGYRDLGDAYVTKAYDLSDDLDAVYEHLRAFKAQGGGDTPEHVGRALGEAVSTFSWSTSSKTMKMIFLVGDAPPQLHRDGWNYLKWAKKAGEKGLVVNTIRCGNMGRTGQAFQEIAQLAQGSFTTIDASGGMVAIQTPYDKEIETLNKALAATALYGGKGRRRAQSKAQRIGDMKGEALANRVKYQLGRKKRSSTPDAVGILDSSLGTAKNLAASPKALESLKADELPQALKKMSKKEQRAHVAKLAKKRQRLTTKLTKLSEARDTFIAGKKDAKSDSFDAQVMRDIKKRGAKFGLSF